MRLASDGQETSRRTARPWAPGCPRAPNLPRTCGIARHVHTPGRWRTFVLVAPTGCPSRQAPGSLDPRRRCSRRAPSSNPVVAAGQDVVIRNAAGTEVLTSCANPHGPSGGDPPRAVVSPSSAWAPSSEPTPPRVVWSAGNCRYRSSQAIQASSPWPVVAETSRMGTPGLSSRTSASKTDRSNDRCGSRSILLSRRRSAASTR